MKKKIISFITTQWLVIWIVVVSLTLVTLIASAEALVTLSPMKRVVVTKDGHGVLFSSNLLTDLIEEEVEEDDGEGGMATTTKIRPAYQPIYRTVKATGSYDVDLFLWNYNALDETTFYSENINYRLDIALTDSSGNDLDADDVGSRSITITPVSPSGTGVTLNSSKLSDSISPQSLLHDDSHSTQNAYTVSYSSGWNLKEDTEICIMIQAVPTTKTGGGSYSDLKTLGRILGLRQSREDSGSNGWKATISEKTETNSPTSFDAYNLVLSGSGSSTITVSWDTSKLDINKYFYDSNTNVYGYDFLGNEIVDNETTNGWHTIIINADTSKSSQKNRNRYSIQLYKLGALDDISNPSNWEFFAYNKTATESPNAWIRVNIS